VAGIRKHEPACMSVSAMVRCYLLVDVRSYPLTGLSCASLTSGVRDAQQSQGTALPL
jgi:hypothetical protein